jgi:hypothetical protein
MDVPESQATFRFCRSFREVARTMATDEEIATARDMEALLRGKVQFNVLS